MLPEDDFSRFSLAVLQSHSVVINNRNLVSKKRLCGSVTIRGTFAQNHEGVFTMTKTIYTILGCCCVALAGFGIYQHTSQSPLQLSSASGDVGTIKSGATSPQALGSEDKEEGGALDKDNGLGKNDDLGKGDGI